MNTRTQAHAHDEPMLAARGIVNRFGKQLVHDKLSLDVMPGEIIGIAGGSGSGKSVLLKTLTGLPLSSTSPLFGRCRPVSVLSSTDLPEPEPPAMPMISPGMTSRPSLSCTKCLPKRLTIRRAARIGPAWGRVLIGLFHRSRESLPG